MKGLERRGAGGRGHLQLPAEVGGLSGRRPEPSPDRGGPWGAARCIISVWLRKRGNKTPDYYSTWNRAQGILLAAFHPDRGTPRGGGTVHHFGLVE